MRRLAEAAREARFALKVLRRGLLCWSGRHVWLRRGARDLCKWCDAERPAR